MHGMARDLLEIYMSYKCYGIHANELMQPPCSSNYYNFILISFQLQVTFGSEPYSKSNEVIRSSQVKPVGLSIAKNIDEIC